MKAMVMSVSNKQIIPIYKTKRKHQRKGEKHANYGETFTSLYTECANTHSSKISTCLLIQTLF